MDYIYVRQRTTDKGQQTLSINDVKELLKDWIKLYPNSFAPDVELKIYQLEDGDIIIRLHEDMSSLAVSLLVLYIKAADNGQQTTAYITIDDTEVLLKQNIGKRAMVYISQQSTDNSQQFLSCRDASNTQYDKQEVVDTSDKPTSVRFLLDDNYVLDYDFERKPQPVKDGGLRFEESEFVLPEGYATLRVGDVIKKKIDEVLEPDVLTPKKMMWYLICGAVGLAIGFLIVYLTGK